MCAVASSLVLVKHTKRATNISRFCKDIVEVESLVGFLKGIRSPGAAEAADTRSIAVELLSRLACGECLISLARADVCFAARVPSSSVSQGAATRVRTRMYSMYTQTRGCAAKRA